MLSTEVADGIHRIEDASVNWYLVEDADGVTIVDAGLPGSWRSLREALGRVGRSLDDVAALVLTHAHLDHIGFAERARRELGVPVWIHRDDMPLLANPWRYEHERSRLPYLLRSPRVAVIGLRWARMGVLRTPRVRSPEAYQGGDELDVPGRPRVIASPGHTRGHSSLHLPDRDALIAGDALVTRNPYTGAAGPRIVAGAANVDSARALASLDALARTGARTLLPGHGEPWLEGVGAAVEQARVAGSS